MIQGSGQASFTFAQVCAMFTLHLVGRTYRVLVVWTYKKRGRNKLTGYIELNGVPDGRIDLYFLETITCTVHILPPTDSNNQYVVQDLYDGDMYLHLISSWPNWTFLEAFICHFLSVYLADFEISTCTYTGQLEILLINQLQL